MSDHRGYRSRKLSRCDHPRGATIIERTRPPRRLRRKKLRPSRERSIFQDGLRRFSHRVSTASRPARPNYRISQLDREAFARSGRDRASFSRRLAATRERESERGRGEPKSREISKLFISSARGSALNLARRGPSGMSPSRFITTVLPAQNAVPIGSGPCLLFASCHRQNSNGGLSLRSPCPSPLYSIIHR